MIYHSEADVAALYVDAHSGVRSHNVLIELVALAVIVLPEIPVSIRMIMARDVEVNVALLEQRQNEAAQVGLSVELVITLVATRMGKWQMTMRYLAVRNSSLLMTCLSHSVCSSRYL